MKRPGFVLCASIVAGVLLAVSPALHAANNWPNWRGPNFDGSLEGVNPPTEWSATKNVKWKVAVPGKGSSSPVVWNDQIILLTAVPVAGGQQAYTVISFELATGKERWKKILKTAAPNEAGHQTNTFASSSAVTDGNRIYVDFGSQGIYCLDMQGKEIWKKDLGRMQTRNGFGEGSSPALVKNTLIVPWDQESQSFIYALDTAKGDVRWKTPRDERTTWATPLAVEYGGKTQIVTNGTRVRSYDLETGALVWECGGQVANPIPSPVRQDDFVICMTGFQGNAVYALPLDAKGDISNSSKIRWFNREAGPYVASPTLYKGILYLTKERNGVLTALDAKTGKVLIPQTRLGGIQQIYASLIAAADKVYITGRDGTTIVIKHGEKLEELAQNRLGEPVDASPAIIGDRLLIRGAEHLYCIGE